MVGAVQIADRQAYAEPRRSAGPGKPPTFEEAKNRRQRVRAAGLSPDHWYPVEWDRALPRGAAIEVKFWGRSVAVYRDEDGAVHAVENRCAHRQLKLTRGGEVKGKNLVCNYHGWEFDGDGRLAKVPHDLFGNKMPKCRVASFPVAVRYGLIWMFPGDPALVAARTIPAIPEIEGPEPWGTMPIDFVLGCHHSMIIDNVSDFSHAYLHRRFKPFSDARLTRLETVGDTVHLSYETKVGRGRFSGLFVDRKATNTNAMDLAYEYPYQRSDTDGKIKHWLFVLPIDERTSRAFFIFYFHPSALKVPLLPWSLPRPVLRAVLRASRRLLLQPLLTEDKLAVEAEQEGYEAHYDKPIAELNPCVREFQDLTIRKWEEHLARTAPRGRERVPMIAEP
jgi:phenylpropionate dioxygenase-like ring-hydroxylating dioxygenase large terminal subunit